jgi:hypothetical protein
MLVVRVVLGAGLTASFASLRCAVRCALPRLGAPGRASDAPPRVQLSERLGGAVGHAFVLLTGTSRAAKRARQQARLTRLEAPFRSGAVPPAVLHEPHAAKHVCARRHQPGVR